MGQVREATQTWDGRKVALKVLRRGLTSPRARRSLINEARTAAALTHPNLVAMLDVGEDPTLGLYLVQELAEGTSLDVALEEGLSVDEALAIVAGVLEGLTAAHAAGVVHGDVKPGNVIITYAGLTKLCDFGVAQTSGPRKDAPGRRVRAGTPRYMAPEQFETRVELDPRADLYAVGAILAEVLAGRPPFEGHDSVANVLVAKHEPLDLPIVDRHGRPLPVELLDLVRALLAPDLRRRPRFATEVLRTLRASLLGLPSWKGEGSDRLSAARASARVPSTELLPTLSIGGEAPATLVGSAPPAHLRGDDAPVTSVVEARHVPGTSLLHVRPPPLVGRTREMALLRELFRRTVETRSVQAILLEGETGVGKSRLAEWGLAEGERSGLMEGVAARFSCEAGAVAQGLRGLVARIFAPAAPDAAAGARASLALLRERGCDGELEGDDLVAWLSMGRQEDPLDAHTAAGLAASALRAHAQIRPTLLWLDDVVFATDGAFELIGRLLEDGRGPLVLLLTADPSSLRDARHVARLGAITSHPSCHRVPLSRLDAEGRTALLRLVLPLSKAVAVRAATAVDATPRDLLRVVDRWLERGLLRFGEDGLEPVAASARLEDLPEKGASPRLQTLLDSLPEAKSVLELIAWLGAWSSARTLHHVGEALELDREWIDLVLEEGILRGVLRNDGGDVHRFSDAAVAEAMAAAATGDLGPRRVAVAEALLDVHRDGGPFLKMAAAHHLHAAGRRPAALRCLLDAAEHLARWGDLALARLQLTAATEWLNEDDRPELDPFRARLLHVEARVHYFALDYATARASARRAVERFASQQDVTGLLRAQSLELRILFYADRIEECETLLRSVRLQMRAHLGPETDFFRQFVHLDADLCSLRGDPRRARDVLRAGVSAYRGGDTFVLRMELALAEAAVGNLDLAEAEIETLRAQRKDLDVYYLTILRDADSILAILRGERRPRHLYVDKVADLRARRDRWRSTAALVVLAAYDVRFGEATAVATSTLAIEAFSRVPNDEGIVHAMLAALEHDLAARGQAALASRVHALLARRHRVGRGRV